jgi:hypothetical protein
LRRIFRRTLRETSTPTSNPPAGRIRLGSAYEVVDLLRAGGLAHDAATSVGIDRTTYYRHRLRSPAFAQATDRAQADARLEAAALVAKNHPTFYLPAPTASTGGSTST